MVQPEELVIRAFNSNVFGGSASVDCQFVVDLAESGLSRKQIANVLQIVERTCLNCYDKPRDCQCWNDE